MATRYQQGRDTEYKAQADLEAMGYTTTRAASSKGKADVVAWNHTHIRFIQCKRYTDRPGAFTADLTALMLMEIPPNASTELWLKKANTPGWIERTLIKHSHDGTMDVSTLDDLGREKRFTQSINPDEVTAVAAQLAAAAKKERIECKQRQTRKPRPSPAPTTTAWLAQRSSSSSPTTATPPAGATAARPSERGPATSA